jgi:hypothetical protein
MHLAGTTCILPGSSLCFQIFPALIRVHDLSYTEPRFVGEWPLPVQGPVKDFTAQLDLEKAAICVWGQTQKGFMRYRLHASQDAFSGVVEKSPEELGLPTRSDTVYLSPVTDRLSLGSHKAQDWELVLRRRDLKEIFPMWLRLGQLVSEIPGTTVLLEECRQAIDEGKKEFIASHFQNLFSVGFKSLLTPRSIDDEFQGIIDNPIVTSGSSLVLLTEGAKLIRSLFFQINRNQLKILPVLLPELHCGRFLNLCFGDIGTIDLEWSKKSIRRMVLYAKKKAALNIEFQKGLKLFRLRKGIKDPGQKIRCGEAIEISEDQHYFFDNFER